MQTCYHDYKSLQPHTDTDHNGDQPEQEKITAHTLDPEKLWGHDVAENQRPVVLGIRTVHAIPDHEALKSVPAIPPEKGFHDVAIADDQSRSEHHFGHIVHVTHRDEALETVELTQRDR